MSGEFDPSGSAGGRVVTGTSVRGRAVAGGVAVPAIALLVWLGVRTLGPAASTPDVPGRETAQASAAGLPEKQTTPIADPAPRKSKPAQDITATQVPTDEERRRTIVGVWTREYFGQWTMTIEEGGTGTLVVTPDRLWALAIGPKITVHIEWQVKDGLAVFDTLRGEPESSFNAAMKLWKKHQARKIVQLNEEKLVYLSDDGKSNSEWTRAE